MLMVNFDTLAQRPGKKRPGTVTRTDPSYVPGLLARRISGDPFVSLPKHRPHRFKPQMPEAEFDFLMRWINGEEPA